MNRWWLFAVPLVCVAGCGFPAAKVDEAKGHVKAALDKWQAGGKPDELKPVEFNEALWNAGEKLVSFEMGEARYVDSAQAVRCQVTLTLQKGKAKPRTENAVYDVNFGPTVKVVNNPMP
ncbi:MAG: hypothetical protein ACOVT5_12665 [Armatimonadaceae bacterium]